jgi:L-aminopeptidase/D-esterase-like protein
VVGAALYDLDSGSARVRPGAEEGYAACEAAVGGPPETGRVGAATGAKVGRWRGPEHARPGALGAALQEDGPLRVAAIVAVNAIGDLRERDVAAGGPAAAGPGEATAIGAILTNARLTKRDCLLLAQSGQDGLARAIEPAHTAFDGDALVAASCGALEADTEQVRVLAARAVEAAVRSELEA